MGLKKGKREEYLEKMDIEEQTIQTTQMHIKKSIYDSREGLGI